MLHSVSSTDTVRPEIKATFIHSIENIPTAMFRETGLDIRWCCSVIGVVTGTAVGEVAGASAT